MLVTIEKLLPLIVYQLFSFYEGQEFLTALPNKRFIGIFQKERSQIAADTVQRDIRVFRFMNRPIVNYTVCRKLEKITQVQKIFGIQ